MIRSFGGDNGTIPDLSDGTAAGVQDRHQKRACKILDLAVLVARDRRDGDAGRVGADANKLARLRSRRPALLKMLAHDVDKDRGGKPCAGFSALGRSRAVGQCRDQYLGCGSGSRDMAGKGVLAGKRPPAYARCRWPSPRPTSSARSFDAGPSLGRRIGPRQRQLVPHLRVRDARKRV